MYKCTECGLEFEIKPEYCDCGNNEFVISVESNSEISKNVETLSEIQEPELNSADFAQSYINQSVDSNKSEKKYLPFSPFALIFFIGCVVLSLIILCFWNPIKDTANVEEKPIKVVSEKPIPSIDKIWKNPVITENVGTIKTNSAIPEQSVKPVVKAKPVQNVKPKQTSTTVKKNTSNSNVKTTKTSQKPTSTVPAANKVQPAQSSAEDAAKKAAEAEKAAKEAKLKAEALAAAENAKKAALAKQEFANYKINLRNSIGRKIDFTKVIGDGNCTVAFKLDSSGKLINRSFEKQSTNITLNNAVYNAVMATPSFTPPSSAYRGETLRLYVRFTNGNFAITLD